MHSENSIVVKTQLTMVIDDWAKVLDNHGQVDTFILKRLSIHLRMDSLIANYFQLFSNGICWTALK